MALRKEFAEKIPADVRGLLPNSVYRSNAAIKRRGSLRVPGEKDFAEAIEGTIRQPAPGIELGKPREQ